MWKDIKNKILEHSKEKWTDIYYKLKNDYSLDKDYVKSFINHENKYIADAAVQHLNVLNHFDVRRDYENVVSIKLIIPSYCQAKCPFCFMEDYKIQEHNYDLFLNNFINSLNTIVNKLYGKQPISLDITGNEPTFDTHLLNQVLIKLKNSNFMHKINRVVLTTNGYRLNEVIDSLQGVVNYVNISVHHHNINTRRDIFNTWKIPTDEELTPMILKLLDNDIKTSAVCVVYKQIDNFPIFAENFICWAKNIGFESVRFRGDCLDENFAPIFNTYIQDIKDTNKYTVIQEENTNDSHWARFVDSQVFFFFMLQGVTSTFEHSIGIEYIVNDDGLPYLDYYKQVPFLNNYFNLPVGYIFDRKKTISLWEK